jgi:hypothetical protein
LFYRLRTYQLRPRAVAEAERRFAAACQRRCELSPLAAAFRTEIGPLNRVLHFWPCRSPDEGARIDAAAAAAGVWPPPLADLLVEDHCELFGALAFSPEIRPGEVGPYFEMRTYLCRPKELEKMIAIWELALPQRLAFGPLAAALVADVGDLRRFVHLWPYRSLDERQRQRERMRAAGVWPPPLVARSLGLPNFELEHQESMLLVSSLYSPLR